MRSVIDSSNVFPRFPVHYFPSVSSVCACLSRAARRLLTFCSTTSTLFCLHPCEGSSGDNYDRHYRDYDDNNRYEHPARYGYEGSVSLSEADAANNSLFWLCQLCCQDVPTFVVVVTAFANDGALLSGARRPFLYCSTSCRPRSLTTRPQKHCLRLFDEETWMGSQRGAQR